MKTDRVAFADLLFNGGSQVVQTPMGATHKGKPVNLRPKKRGYKGLFNCLNHANYATPRACGEPRAPEGTLENPVTSQT